MYPHFVSDHEPLDALVVEGQLDHLSLPVRYCGRTVDCLIYSFRHRVASPSPV